MSLLFKPSADVLSKYNPKEPDELRGRAKNKNWGGSRKESQTAVEIDGVYYPTMKAAREHHNVAKTTIARRLESSDWPTWKKVNSREDV